MCTNFYIVQLSQGSCLSGHKVYGPLKPKQLRSGESGSPNSRREGSFLLFFHHLHGFPAPFPSSALSPPGGCRHRCWPTTSQLRHIGCLYKIVLFFPVFNIQLFIVFQCFNQNIRAFKASMIAPTLSLGVNPQNFFLFISRDDWTDIDSTVGAARCGF